MFRFFLVLQALILSSYAQGNPPPFPGVINAVDSTTLISEAIYAETLRQGFTKAIIRGLEASCGAGAEVNSNFVGSYNNARAAGYTDIDTYWMPCNGNGNNCKPYSAQLALLARAFIENHMDIGTIWLDIEQFTYCSSNWNYGTAGNIAQARQLLGAIQASGFNYGIYSSEGEWGSIFGSDSFVLDDSVPLWFSTFGLPNNDNTEMTLAVPFGGWTTGVGQQYQEASGDGSGLFDYSVFS